MSGVTFVWKSHRYCRKFLPGRGARFGILAFCILGWPLLMRSDLQSAKALGADEAEGGEETLTRIADTILRERAKIASLWVEYNYKAELLSEPEAVKKYLHLIYLVDERRSFAFMDGKRYFKLTGPQQADILAPNGIMASWYSP